MYHNNNISLYGSAINRDEINRQMFDYYFPLINNQRVMQNIGRITNARLNELQEFVDDLHHNQNINMIEYNEANVLIWRARLNLITVPQPQNYNIYNYDSDSDDDNYNDFVNDINELNNFNLAGAKIPDELSPREIFDNNFPKVNGVMVISNVNNITRA